jgi:hypothetical protein
MTVTPPGELVNIGRNNSIFGERLHASAGRSTTL